MHVNLVDLQPPVQALGERSRRVVGAGGARVHRVALPARVRHRAEVTQRAHPMVPARGLEPPAVSGHRVAERSNRRRIGRPGEEIRRGDERRGVLALEVPHPSRDPRVHLLRSRARGPSRLSPRWPRRRTAPASPEEEAAAYDASAAGKPSTASAPIASSAHAMASAVARRTRRARGAVR